MKLSTIKLIGILAISVGAYFAIDALTGKRKSEGLKSELVSFDEEPIDRLKLTSPDKEVELVKSSGIWELKLQNGQMTGADQESVKRSLEALKTIKPSRLTSKKKEKWGEYQVDSTGTRVEVFSGNRSVLDILLGKFGVTGQRDFHTFVRLSDEEEIYRVDGFMSFSVPADPSAYKVKTIINVDPDSIAEVKFIYPSDSSFVLENKEQSWSSGGQVLDSIKVDSYFKQVKNLSSSSFYEGVPEPRTPVYTVEYLLKDGDRVRIDSFDEGGKIVKSSENENYFTDESLFNKVFVGLNSFR